MINEFYSHAKPSNNKAKKLFISLLAIAALICVLYLAIDRFKGIVGLFCVFAIAFAVFIYTKYVSAEYFYDVTHDSNGSPVFVVRQVTGKRSTTLCRIDLHTIVAVKRLSAKEKREHKTEAGCKKYYYLPTLMPESVVLLTVNSPSERAEIFIEVQDEFASLLRSYAIEARESRFDSDDF